ncbi:MAG TPA: peptidoglycan bridge formation glycyltransferase FemA/FemB family protein [Patescibacteria group bacterium]|nr:peptidoglycan bridge formation glycyltransferase FemA/FemB family protein [Patescibacteria group bacterium]
MESFQAKPIVDQKVWDTFVKEVCPEAFFQSWKWGEVEKENGHHVNRYGFYTENALFGVAQLIHVKARRGEYLHVRHGPILRIWDKESVSFVHAFLHEYAKKVRASFVRVSPLVDSSYEELFRSFGFHHAPIHNMDAEISYVVTLTSQDAVLRHMRKNTRYMIRKSQAEKKLTVRTGVSNDLLDDFLTLFTETAKRKNFVVERGIREEVSVFSKTNEAELIVAYRKDRPVAGSMIIFWGNQGIYRYAASSEEGKSLAASYLVQWTAIQHALERGLPYYNLWGGVADLTDTSHPWYGITVFKKGFGGEKRQYLHAQDLPVGRSYVLTYLIEHTIKFVRGYGKILGLRVPSFVRSIFGV